MSGNVERLLDGRTQVWLARKLGVTGMYIHRRMRGHAQWSADDLRRLSEALVTSPAELLAPRTDEAAVPDREAGHAAPQLLARAALLAVVTLLAVAVGWAAPAGTPLAVLLAVGGWYAVVRLLGAGALAVGRYARAGGGR